MTPNLSFKPAFANHLDVIADDIPYTLRSPLCYYSAILGGFVDVPRGFVTDLASIPQLLQNLIPKEGKYNRPAVVHDFLYKLGAYRGVAISRKTADLVLLEAMHAVNVDPDRAAVIYAGVRIGGWWPWWGYRRKGARRG